MKRELRSLVDGTLKDKDFVKYLTYTAGLCHLYKEGDKELIGPSGEHTYLKDMPDDFGGDINTIRTYDEDGTPLIIASSVRDYCDKYAELVDDSDEGYQYYLDWLKQWN